MNRGNDPLTGPLAESPSRCWQRPGSIVTESSGSFRFSVNPGGSYSLTDAGSDNFFQPPFHTHHQWVHDACLTEALTIVNVGSVLKEFGDRLRRAREGRCLSLQATAEPPTSPPPTC